MANNASSGDGLLFDGLWSKDMIMDMYDRLPRAMREAIAYADDNYSIEELCTADFFRSMSIDEVINFIWENSDGFEIRYPHHVRVQYQRARAASDRNRYVSDWFGRIDSMEVFNGSYPGGPLRFDPSYPVRR